MLWFVDGLLGNFDQGFNDIFLLILQVVSLAGMLMLLFGVIQGIAFKKWQTQQFVIAIVILVLVGPAPGWRLLTGEVPATFSFLKS